MQPESDQFLVLEQVSRFSGFSRYGGVMPMHLLALREDVVESLVHGERLPHGRRLPHRPRPPPARHPLVALPSASARFFSVFAAPPVVVENAIPFRHSNFGEFDAIVTVVLRNRFTESLGGSKKESMLKMSFSRVAQPPTEGRAR